MNEYSLIISISAIVISGLTFLHTVFTAATKRKLDLIVTKTELLTDIVNLRLEYEQELNNLKWLKELAVKINNERADLVDNEIETYESYIKKTREHYESLLKTKYPTAEALLNMAHHVESLKAQIKAENFSLLEIKEKIEKYKNN